MPSSLTHQPCGSGSSAAAHAADTGTVPSAPQEWSYIEPCLPSLKLNALWPLPIGPTEETGSWSGQATLNSVTHRASNLPICDLP